MESLQSNRCIWLLKHRLRNLFPLLLYMTQGARVCISCWAACPSLAGYKRCYNREIIVFRQPCGGFVVVFLGFFSFSYPYLCTNLWCILLFLSSVAGWINLKRRLMFTANNLPVSAAEWQLLVVWLLLFAYEDSAVLCHCGRTEVETYTKKPEN